MKMLWCWRCKMEIPMLDEEEFAVASKLYSNGIKSGIDEDKRSIRFKPLLDYYNQVTGWDETEPNAIMHHRIEQYGPACEKCGKPYRTKQASFCAACGHKRLLTDDLIHANLSEKTLKAISTVYFISGLGIDERAFKKVTTPKNLKAVYLQWPVHNDNDSLEDYCKKIAALIDTSENFSLVGFSFGGIIAIELSKMLPVTKLVIISSISSHSELPSYLRFIGWLKLYSLLPAGAINKTSSITNWFNNVKNEDDKNLINQIIQESDPHFVKWAIDKILNWCNNNRPANLYHVHGKADRLFPCANVKADKLIDGGGHFMVLTHADEINAILQQQLSMEQ